MSSSSRSEKGYLRDESYDLNLQNKDRNHEVAFMIHPNTSMFLPSIIEVIKTKNKNHMNQ